MTAAAILAAAALVVAAFALAVTRTGAAPMPAPSADAAACDVAQMMLSGVRATRDIIAWGATDMPTPVVVFSVGGGLHAYGVAEGSTVGMDLKGFHPGPDYTLWDAIGRVLRTGEPETIASEQEVPGGGVRHYVTSFSRIIHRGAPALVAFVTDVTDIERRARASEARADAARRTLDQIGQQAIAMLAVPRNA